jgi:hypothetical protein
MVIGMRAFTVVVASGIGAVCPTITCCFVPDAHAACLQAADFPALDPTWQQTTAVRQLGCIIKALQVCRHKRAAARKLGKVCSRGSSSSSSSSSSKWRQQTQLTLCPYVSDGKHPKPL